MTSRDIPVRVIREQLQQRVATLVPELVPGGRREGGVWSAPNPTRGGDSRGSFKVWMRGPAAGGFKEYDAGDDEKGDIIDLIAYVHGSTRKDAIQWAKDYLGLGNLDQATRERMKRDSERRKLKDAKAEAEKDQRKRRRAFDMWLGAQKSLRYTVAETYLLSRGIELDALPHLEEGELRFLPALEWWNGAVWEERLGRRTKIKPGPSFPAIIAPFRNWRGEITGVHCTYLSHDGLGKADRDDAAIAPPKLVYGAVSESVIRLTRGPSGLSPEEFLKQKPRPEGDPLVISEGIETGLSVAMAAPEARVWAAGSIGNLGNVYADHPCVSAIIIAAENDSKPQAQAAFERAMARLEEHGKPVADMRSHHGNDFNDLMR